MSTQDAMANLARKMKEQLDGISQDDANRAAALAVAVLGEPKPEFDTAVDWLLNSRHTADPNIQDEFWALADGLVTEDELRTLSSAEVRERRKQAGA